MSQVKTHATEVQKKTEPARQLEQEAARQPERGPVQQMAPQAAYRRVQVNRNGLSPADLLALQRIVGNRMVQRQFAQEPRSLNQSLDPNALTEAEIYQEIQFIRQWLHANSGKSSEKDRLMAVLQSLENKVCQGEKRRKAAQASKPKAYKAQAYRSVDITKLTDFELEQEYNAVQQRLLKETRYPALDNEYLKTLEAEITKRQSLPKSKNQASTPPSKVLLNYDDFTLQDGRPKSIAAQASIMYDWQKLEQVYADTNHGDERAKLFWQFLERDAATAGINIAQELHNHPCQIVPAMQCVIHLERYDFLKKDKPGALHLRQVMYKAFEKRSHEIGLVENLILAAANAILALAGVKGALSREVRAVGTEAAGRGRALTQEGKAATIEVAGEGKTFTGEAKTSPPTEAPAIGAGVSTSQKYANLTIRQLRKLLVTDPAAVEELRLRYRAMTDRQLADLARRGDAMAKSVREQRIPSNEKELQKILGSDYRPPHEATAVARDAQGKILWSRKLASGNMTPAEEALGYPQSALATHTEARAVAQAPLVRGGTLSISGQYDPCGSCRRAMAAAATESGATIMYWWPGGRVVFKP